MLMAKANAKEKDLMIAVIGPFWDANETWLVLGVGILLVAFPQAHGDILQALYLPVAIMLAGLILRGVAFDFRTKAQPMHHNLWNAVFSVGSLISTCAQGYMLGAYIVGFKKDGASIFFSVLVALALVAGYLLLGAARLIDKTHDQLQLKAILWAKSALWGTAIGLAVISLVTPMMSESIFHKWFAWPNILWVLPIPTLAILSIFYLHALLGRLPLPQDRHAGRPFLVTCAIFMSGFFGLAYSFFPYIVPAFDGLPPKTIWQAAAAPEALLVILIGALLVLPAIVFYTMYAYNVFSGKVTEKLDY